MEPEHIAYHEAGHAFISHLLGFGEVGKVSIEPKGILSGHTAFPGGATATLDDEASIVKMVAVLLAGDDAVEILTGEESTKIYRERLTAAAILYWSATGMNVREEFEQLTDDSDLTKLEWVLDTYDVLIVTINEGVRKMLRENWKAVEALANALLDKGTLQRDEVESVLRDNTHQGNV